MLVRRTALTGLLATLLFASGTIAAPRHTDPDDKPSPTADPTGTSIPTAAPRKWEHPGVFVSSNQLQFVADKVSDGAQPWSQAFTSMLADPLASPSRTANPYATVECGPTSTPNIGCYDERNDSMAAYMNALAYYITKSTAYAEKAVYYMNAWASTIKAHTNSNAPLQAGWSAANWVRAGELMRYAKGPGHDVWEDRDVAVFENMLRSVYVPIIFNGSTNMGNWELGMLCPSLSHPQLSTPSHPFPCNSPLTPPFLSNDRVPPRRRRLPRRRRPLHTRHVSLRGPRPSLHLPNLRRPSPRSRPRHQKHHRSDHQILERPNDISCRWYHAGNVSRLCAYELWDFFHRTCGRDGADSGE